MNTQPEPKPDYTALWNEYCRTTPLDARMNHVEFIRRVRATHNTRKSRHERGPDTGHWGLD